MPQSKTQVDRFFIKTNRKDDFHEKKHTFAQLGPIWNVIKIKPVKTQNTVKNF